MSVLQKLFNNKFFQGGLFFTASSSLINFLNYLFNLISARILGPFGYSEIASLFSYIALFAIPITVISSFVTQKVASSGDKKYEFVVALQATFLQKIKRWWFIFLIFLALSPFIPALTNLSFTSGVLIIPLILMTFIFTFYSSILQGLNLLITVSLISIFAVFLKLAGPVLVLLKIDGFYTILLFIVLSVLLPLLVTIFSVRTIFRKNKQIPLLKIDNRIRSLLFNSQFILILLSTLAMSLLNNFDIIFVKKNFSGLEAGIYSSWSLFAKIILYGIGPLISVSFIFFSGQKGKSQNVFRMSLIFLAVVGIISYITYTFFAAEMINIFFGKKFSAVLPYLSKAAIFGSLYAFLNFVNSYYVAKRSKISLILPLLSPVYLILLIFINKEIAQIMNLNILFTFTALIIHGVVYVKEELNLDSKLS